MTTVPMWKKHKTYNSAVPEAAEYQFDNYGQRTVLLIKTPNGVLAKLFLIREINNNRISKLLISVWYNAPCKLP